MSTQVVRYPPVITTITATNPSVGVNGAPIPLDSTLVGGENPSGNLEPLQTDASGNLQVNVVAGTLTVLNPSVSATGAAVPPDATYGGMNVAGNLIGLTGTADGLKVDGSAVTQPISAVALPLPAGAATSAKQPALGVAGTASTDVITVQGIASMTPLLVDGSGSTQPISGTVTANQGTANATPWNENIAQFGGSAVVTGIGASGAGIPRTSLSNDSKVIAWDGTNNTTVKAASTPAATTDSALVVAISPNNSIQTKSPINTTGSGSAASATVSTVATLTAPANAAGFVLMSLDTSTANIRWAIGRTASTTLGQQLQPARDSGFVPCGANVSICAESGTQNYDIQWVSQ